MIVQETAIRQMTGDLNYILTFSNEPEAVKADNVNYS